MLVARRRFERELALRRKCLRAFSWPIFLATLVDILGDVSLTAADRLGDGLGNLRLWGLMFTLPSFIVCLIDLRRKDPPRFSLAHAIFLIGVLYRLSLRAAEIDSRVWNACEDAFARYEADGMLRGVTAEQLTPIVTMIAHFSIFILVTMLGKLSLTLVATKNCCVHLLFPFQFFDFLFLYVFFTIRAVDKPITTTWVIQQVLLQVNIVMRNSGTTDALLKRKMGQCIARLLCASKRFNKVELYDDPIFRLQYLARITIQYDLADLTALILTPAIVSFFTWRDGFFTLEGTGILVRHCDLIQLWGRFGILLLVKPIAALLARVLLRRKMRKLLLGKPTIHGTSQLAAKIIASRKIVAKTADGTSIGSDEDIQSRFGLAQEHLQIVQEDLSLSGLDFRYLRRKQLRKWRFYTAVALIQCFAAFPVRRERPFDVDLQPHIDTFDTALATGNFTTVLAGSAALGESLVPLFTSGVWMYITPTVVIQYDYELQETLTQSAFCYPYYLGWPARST